MKKLVDGKLVSLTVIEIKQHEKSLSDHEAELPMLQWYGRMKETDNILPRYAEDIIDVLSKEQKAQLAPEIIAAYNLKKTLRNERPVNADL